MLLRQTLLYLPSQLAGPAMQFVFAIIWTHWLTQDDYGHLTLLIAAQEAIFLCCVSWWSLFVLRFFGGAGQDEAQRMVAAEPAILVYACVPQAIINLAALAAIGEIGNLQLAVASTAYVVGRSFVTYLGERVRTKAMIGLYTIAQTGSLAVGGLLGFLLVAFGSATAASVMSGFAIANLAVALWLLSRLEIGGTGQVDRAVLARAAAFGLPLVVAGIINWVNLNGIRVVVEAMGGAASVGLLAVGWGLGQRLSTTAAMFVITASFPLAARSLEEGRRATALRQMRHGGTLLVGCVLPATIGLWLITPPFVHLLISEPFREVTLAILPLAAATGAIRNIRVHYADMAFILFERTGLSVFVNSVEAVFTIALCAAGYAYGGIAGGVAGACVAATIGAVLAFGIAVRLGLPMPVADWARIALATAVMALVLKVFEPARSYPDAVRIGLDAVGGVCLYGAALACLFPVRVGAAVRALRARTVRRDGQLQASLK